MSARGQELVASAVTFEPCSLGFDWGVCVRVHVRTHIHVYAFSSVYIHMEAGCQPQLLFLRCSFALFSETGSLSLTGTGLQRTAPKNLPVFASLALGLQILTIRLSFLKM